MMTPSERQRWSEASFFVTRMDRVEVQDDLMLDAHLLEASYARVLLKISETGSFTATAAALGVSQPSISQQVKRIERVVGCTLFVRGSLGVKLTSDGETVVDYARAMLSLGRSLRLQLAENAGRSRVGIGMAQDIVGSPPSPPSRVTSRTSICGSCPALMRRNDG